MKKEKFLLQNYQGQLLIANPRNPDDNLKGSVILMVNYSNSLCIGIQINKCVEHIKLSSICQNMDISYFGDENLYYGGIIGTGKVHVIHSSDWSSSTTVRVNDQLSITSDISVLVDLANHRGPEYFRACAGYWSWSRSLLDNQLGISSDQQNALSDYKWETLPGTIESVFEYDHEEQWYQNLQASAKLQVMNWF